MRKIHLSRRAVLRGGAGGAVALALPRLEAMLDGHGTAYADGTPLPKIFGVWMWPDGVKSDRWFPTTVGPNWELTEGLQPLADVKADVSVVSGFDVKTKGTVHHVGTAAMLSGAPYTKTGATAAGPITTLSMPSIDVLVSRAIGTGTKFRSVEIGVDDSHYTVEGTTGYVLSHNGPNDLNPPEYVPQKLFNRLFGGGLQNPGAGSAGGGATGMGGGPDGASARNAARLAIVDAVLADAQSLRTRLGAQDRVRLESHLDAVHQLEGRLRTAPPPTIPGGPPPPARKGCALPMAPGDLSPVGGMQRHREVNQAMADILAIALSCDLTRVFSYRFGMWHTGVSGAVGAKNDFHTYTHEEKGTQPLVHKHVVFFMECLAYLLGKLKAASYGAGSVLGQSALLCISELREGVSHAVDNMPVLLAGRAGGALKPSTHFRGAADNTSKIHMTVMRALGMNVTSFGAGEGLANTVVPELLA